MEGRPPLTWPAELSSEDYPGTVRREITIESTVVDGRFLFTGRLRDRWYDEATGAGEDIHQYDVRLVAEPPDLTVVSVDVTPGALPFPECPAAAETAERLVGLRLSRGFRDGAIAALGGVEGCSHLLTLVLAIWNEQVVTNYLMSRSGAAASDENLARREGMVNVCSGWREGGLGIRLTRDGQPLPLSEVHRDEPFHAP